MDSPTQPSFIPHEAVVPSAARRSGGGGLSELGTLISILVFIISAALGGGVFLYSQYLQSANASKLSQLNSAESSFDPSLIQQITRLDTRMTTAEQLLAAHLAPSEIFSMLQQSTVQDIAFSTLSLNASNPQQITLTMAGVAGSVNSIALQAQIFSQSGMIQSPIFSDINAAQDGVHFNFSALVNASAISYESLVRGASAQGAQQAQQTQATPAAPSSPFESSTTPAAQDSSSAQ